MNLKKYIEDNKDRFLNELFDLIKIPSVSAVSNHNKDTRKAADFLLGQFKQLGLDKCEICETKGHPIVYAETVSYTHLTLPTKA